MHEKLKEFHNGLANLYEKMQTIEFPQDNLIELGEYQFPFLNSEDLKNLPMSLAKK